MAWKWRRVGKCIGGWILDVGTTSQETWQKSKVQICLLIGRRDTKGMACTEVNDWLWPPQEGKDKRKRIWRWSGDEEERGRMRGKWWGGGEGSKRSLGGAGVFRKRSSAPDLLCSEETRALMNYSAAGCLMSSGTSPLFCLKVRAPLDGKYSVGQTRRGPF